MFSRIHHIATSPNATSIDQYFLAPVVARRVLETFLAFRVPDEHSLDARLFSLDFDDVRKARIYRYLQTNAHSDSISDVEDDLTILSESKAVMIDILALMRATDQQHYDRLVTCVSGSPIDTGP